jgi:hypothetical protein
MSLEAELHKEMIAVYDRVGRETGYWANRYLQKVKQVGGLQAAKNWLKRGSEPTRGLQRLTEIDRLDLSLEALVLQARWSSLFTCEELQVAQTHINVASSSRPSEEVVSSQKLIEGSVHQVMLNAYERNSEARKRCIEHHHAIYKVCEFNFEEKYGAVAQGFIHVHHLKPLSEIQEEYEVNPIADLSSSCLS